MKKTKNLIGICLIAVMLCGCGAATKKEDKTTSKATEISESQEMSLSDEMIVEDMVDEDTKLWYDTDEEFLSSVFCADMRQDGYVPCLLSYDKEHYELDKISSSAHTYVFYLLDKTLNVGVHYSISYDVYERTASELCANKTQKDEDSIVSVDKDGVSYDVYISKTPYIDYDQYGILFLPSDGYKVSIYADASTPEEALAYIYEFDLVPVTEEGEIAETTAAQETETTPEETAAPAETEVPEPTPETTPETIPETNENPPADTSADSE